MLCKAIFPKEFQAEEQTSIVSQILELLEVVNYRQSLPTSLEATSCCFLTHQF